MPVSLEVQHWPIPTFPIFLSHSAEDRTRLIDPVYEKLSEKKIASWYDRKDYPDGIEPIDALQENLLKCHHVVYFITASSVKQGRGWNAAERTISSRINRHFNFGGLKLHSFELPLFFVPFDHSETARSIWNPLRQFGPTCPFRIDTQQAIDWAAERISRFLINENAYTSSAMEIAEKNQDIGNQLKRFNGLAAWLSTTKYS